MRLQHYFTHVLSVVADHGLEEGIAIDGKGYNFSCWRNTLFHCVGIAIDGIGYGDDVNAWGEVIKFSGEKYERSYHLHYVPYVEGTWTLQAKEDARTLPFPVYGV